MDKETLSNYGWIVIAVLVLVVMIALATPFGNFVRDAVKSTTKGLFDVNRTALNSTGLLTDEQQMQEQEFANAEGNTQQKEIKTMIVRIGTERKTFQFEEGMTWEQWINSKYNTDGGFYIDNYGMVSHNVNGSYFNFEDEYTGADRDVYYNDGIWENKFYY